MTPLKVTCTFCSKEVDVHKTITTEIGVGSTGTVCHDCMKNCVRCSKCGSLIRREDAVESDRLLLGKPTPFIFCKMCDEGTDLSEELKKL